MEIKKKRVKNSEDLKDFKSEWERLQMGNDMTAFQGYEWNVLLCEEFFSYSYNRLLCELWIYEVVNDGKRLLIAPLIVQKHSLKLSWAGRKKGIYILGIGSYSDYLNLIYDCYEEDVFILLRTALDADFNKIPLYINNLREDTKIQIELQDRFESYDKIVSVYVDIPNNKEDYLSLLSKNTKQNLRTAFNRMEKDGLEYTLEYYSGQIDKLDVIDRLFMLHTARMKTKSNKYEGSGIHKLSGQLLMKNKSRKEKQYNIVRSSMQRMKNSLTVIVKCNGIIVGYLYGLTDHNTFRVMHNSFSEEYKFYSPMFRGSFDFILQEIEQQQFGLRQIDFTRGTEEYKYRLGGKELACFHYKV